MLTSKRVLIATQCDFVFGKESSECFMLPVKQQNRLKYLINIINLKRNIECS